MLLSALALAVLVSPAEPQARLTVKDVTPRFMAFWRAASAEPQADGDRRFALWKTYDDFAAVPPTREGDVMARNLLAAAWPKYPALISRIAVGAAGMSPDPAAELRRVTSLLRPEKDVDVQLTVYAGMAEHNAFTFAARPGRPVPVVELGDRGFRLDVERRPHRHRSGAGGEGHDFADAGLPKHAVWDVVGELGAAVHALLSAETVDGGG